MKKKSVLSSLSVAAVLLPSLNHAHAGSEEAKAKPDDPALLKKKYDISQPCPPEITSNLCLLPQTKKLLDTKTVQIFTTEASDEQSGDASTAEKGKSDPATDATATDATAATDTTETETGVAPAEADYDPKSIYGVDSKIFTRITRPVKNLFADLMYAYTSVNHNNRIFNLNPARPDPFIHVNTINGYFEIPFTEKMDIKATVGRDATASATPFSYVAINKAGDVRQIVTGASVFDQRNAGTVNLNYYGDDLTTKMLVGASREYDYRSNFIGGEFDLDLNKKNTAAIVGGSYTSNQVIPDQLGAVVPRIGGVNHSFQVLGGMTQLLDNKSLAQLAVTYIEDQGYLRDPYKPNIVPSSRVGISVAAKYLRYLPSFHEGSLNLNYRYYSDDWGVQSSTLEVILRLAFSYGIGVEPGLRYYSQNGAYFYNLLVPPNANQTNPIVYYTNTYQFASYGQITGMLQINKQLTATNTIYVGGQYGGRNASMRLGGLRITNPQEPVFTRLFVSEVYVGVRSVY